MANRYGFRFLRVTQPRLAASLRCSLEIDRRFVPLSLESLVDCPAAPPDRSVDSDLVECSPDVIA